MIYAATGEEGIGNGYLPRDASGHQQAFKSEPVNDMAYFVTLLRYIHQNPTKAGMVSKVGDYDWRDVRGD